MITSIYSSETPAKQVEFNTAGNCILKGHAGRFFEQGECSIDKLQIREVTSHFRNGWIFLVVKPAGLSKGEGVLNKELGAIDVEQIEPLIIDNVVIKAKNLVGKKALKTE